MSQYLILLRDATWNPKEMSPEEMQAVFQRYRAWMNRVRPLGGQKLRDDEGRVLRRNGKGVSVTDGPYAEAKEIMGGFVIVEADSYDDVIRLCQDCPHLDFGSIEIRAIEVTPGP